MGFFRPNIRKYEKAGDIENLLKALKHKSSDVKIGAFKALSKKIADPGIREELKKMMGDADSDVVVTAVLTFYNLGEKVDLEKLNELMQGASQKQKIEVLHIIEEKCKPGDTEISGILIQAVNDSNIHVAEQAIKTIGILENFHSIPYIARRFQEKSPHIRMLVVDSLSSIGGDQVVDSLISVLLDHDAGVRNHAKNALLKIGTDKALKALHDTSFQLILNGMNGIETERIQTIHRIVNQNNLEALGLLHNACSDRYKDVRIEAAKALAAFSKKESIPAISHLLEDKFFDVRLEAVKSLEHFPYQESLDVLEKVMGDHNHSVQHEAKAAYNIIKNKIK